MSKKDEALKLALELKNSASAYWTEKEIPIIEKLIKLLALAEQPAQQEAKIVRWNCPCGNKYTFHGFTEAPPQRTWVGLTDEDKHYLNEMLNLQGRFPVIDAIEAKLKEKNT